MLGKTMNGAHFRLVTWFAVAVAGILMVVVFCLYTEVQDLRDYVPGRKELLTSADITEILSDIEVIEEKRGTTIDKIVDPNADNGNINAQIVMLSEHDGRFLYPRMISDYSGKRMFIDQWGVPFHILLLKYEGEARIHHPAIRERVLVFSTGSGKKVVGIQ
jgi:hypothetical protein